MEGCLYGQSNAPSRYSSGWIIWDIRVSCGYDPNFYRWLAGTRWKARIDWRIECDHPVTGPTQNPNTPPESLRERARSSATLALLSFDRLLDFGWQSSGEFSRCPLQQVRFVFREGASPVQAKCVPKGRAAPLRALHLLIGRPIGGRLDKQTPTISAHRRSQP